MPQQRQHQPQQQQQQPQQQQQQQNAQLVPQLPGDGSGAASIGSNNGYPNTRRRQR